MRCAEPTYHSQFIAKCQIDCVVSVSEPGVTGGNHSATAVQHGSPSPPLRSGTAALDGLTA
jgi:hypothetical protein